MKKYLIIAATLCAPLLVYAQEYQFLVKPPQFIGNINSSGGLIAYINALFNLAVLIGAVMAVFIIASAGLQYMTTDAITNKKDSLNRIRSALMGLIMLLSIWIFFNQINPEILKLKGFDLPAAQTGGGTPPNNATPSGPGSNGNSFIGGSGGGSNLNGFGTGGAPNDDGTFNPERGAF